MTLSLLGLGPMGAPMARNLVDDGGLVVWNRTRAKADPFAALGARVAATPREAAADITLTVLPDLAQVESLLDGEDGLLAGWREQGIADPVLVVHGTVSPSAVAVLAARLAEEHGVRVVDAPLSGGTVGARDATLSIMVGGEEEAVARVLPVLARLGRTVRHLGPSGAGATAKLCNQIVVAGTVAVVSEALLLARTAGLDPEVMVELLQGGLARTTVLEQKSAKWLEDDFAEGGSARNQLKDLRYVREAADAEGVVLPAITAVTGLFERMVADGDGDLDHTGVVRTIARLGAPTPGRHA
ncbi:MULTISPECIES: NAD(P)-dependent oxidoreductase [unclassified Rathayibacter]|uniref:NAD(P)-dependent oxidoreductase n=1 Tax=unclassified Rathayibacter TaxID=2609250 RepID=UPI0021583B2A|nr:MULTISPECIES: NAD(P)-dependent oxidoreductase [unclassified Rathayibacter]